jgi:hypothetical protein
LPARKQKAYIAVAGEESKTLQVTRQYKNANEIKDLANY